MNNCCKNSFAFTLLELIAVIALLGLIALIAIPSYRNFIARNKITAQVSQFSSAIQYARLSAIAKNEKIKLCGSGDHYHCNGAWSAGQIVVTEQGEVLQQFSALDSGIKLIWNSSGSDQDNFLVLLPTGFTNGQKGSFYFCDRIKQQYSQRIIVEQSGRLRVAPLTAEDYESFCS